MKEGLLSAEKKQATSVIFRCADRKRERGFKTIAVRGGKESTLPGRCVKKPGGFWWVSWGGIGGL